MAAQHRNSGMAAVAVAGAASEKATWQRNVAKRNQKRQSSGEKKKISSNISIKMYQQAHLVSGGVA